MKLMKEVEEKVTAAGALLLSIVRATPQVLNKHKAETSMSVSFNQTYIKNDSCLPGTAGGVFNNFSW